MHYARQRRTGDPLTVRRPGPKPSEARASWAAILGEDWASERTISRHWSALTMLWDLGLSDEAKDALTAARRPNGTVNVAEFERQAWSAVFALVERDGGAS